MSLLGSSDEECYVCGKEVGDDPIEEDGKKFCCEDCQEQYEHEEKPDEKEEVCQFC
jgi:hypothetical protein